MTKRPTVGRGLFYTRDSGGKHENTPGEFVRWAMRTAEGLGVAFTGSPETIEAMIGNGRFEDGDLFLDYGVKGNQLQRHGLDALFRVALTDSSVTHLFIPRRDRFARPDDPVDAMQMENTLREAGLTLVFMDKTLPPLGRGKRDLGESIGALVDYDHAGKERRTLAQKIIYAQLNLARLGCSTGGRPPFGFRRWLVNMEGAAVRQLSEGEYVKMAGHHVIWLPGPEEEIALIRRILTMLETMRASRVARKLTEEGVPTPDAGRLRTDGGVKHPTSGVWRQASIVGIARNPLLRGVMEYGRRSMGDRLRFTADGPRELEETDYRPDDKARVVVNPQDARVQAAAKFNPLVEPNQQQRLLEKLDSRAGAQRGKPRCKDPGRNPLGGRVFDIGCGWPMYRQPYKDSFRYLCGLYQQSHGACCKHNHVDGVIATRFLLGCVRQRLLAPALRSRLEQKLRTLAERERARTLPDSGLAARQATLAAVRAKHEQAGKNLAFAEGPDQYRAVSAVFEDLKKQEKALEAEVRRLEHASAPIRDVDEEVAAALSGLDRMEAWAAASEDLGGVEQLFQHLNARIFLRFTEEQAKKRTINKLAGGVVTFGAAPPPVALYEGPTGRRHVKRPTDSQGSVGLGSLESPGIPGCVPGGEGESLGNVNRGDKTAIELFLAGVRGWEAHLRQQLADNNPR